MYGLNNNTGTEYSQANNNISQLNKKINNADKGQKIQKDLMAALDAFEGLKSESGWERLKSGIKLAATASSMGK